jgi:hypothetical protein
MADTPVDFRIEYLRNTRREHYRYTSWVRSTASFLSSVFNAFSLRFLFPSTFYSLCPVKLLAIPLYISCFLPPAHQPPIQWVPGALSLGVKRPECEADPSPPSSAEVKECVELYSHSSNTSPWRGASLNTGTTLPFTLPAHPTDTFIFRLFPQCFSSLHGHMIQHSSKSTSFSRCWPQILETKVYALVLTLCIHCLQLYFVKSLKVKLSLRSIKHHVLNMYGGV